MGGFLFLARTGASAPSPAAAPTQANHVMEAPSKPSDAAAKNTPDRNDAGSTDDAEKLHVPEILYAFFAFFASVPTIFIPLTFSLVATVKEQYVAALANRALASEHDKIFNYQEQFFAWNDAFASAMVISSVTALTTLAIGTIAFATIRPAPPYDCVFAGIAFLVCLFLAGLSTRRVARAKSAERGRKPEKSRIARFRIALFILSGISFGIAILGVFPPPALTKWTRDPLAWMGGLGMLLIVITTFSAWLARGRQRGQFSESEGVGRARRDLIALALQWQVVFVVLGYSLNEFREWRSPLSKPFPDEQAMHIQLIASFFAIQFAIPYVRDYFNIEYKTLFPQSTDTVRALIGAIPASDFENAPGENLEKPLTKRQSHAPLLLWWTGAVAAFSILNVFLTPELYGASGGVWMLCFALTVLLLAMVLIWWDLYQTWYPFTYLRQHERAPLSPAWKEIFLEQYTDAKQDATLSTGALLQLMTFDKFMYQYEDDDFTRLSQTEVQALFDCKPTLKFDGKTTSAVTYPEKDAGPPQPPRPTAVTTAVVTELERVVDKLPPGPLPVIYFGCGYAEWFPDFDQQLRSRGCLPEYILVDAVTIPDSHDPNDEKNKLWTDKTENRLANLEVKPIHAETFSFLRAWAKRSEAEADRPSAQSALEISDEDDEWYNKSNNTSDKRDMFKGWKVNDAKWGYRATRNAFTKCDEISAKPQGRAGNSPLETIADPVSSRRPLIVLANNTYGQLIDPQPAICTKDPKSACLHPAASLETLSLQSRERFLHLLRDCFPSGFYLLLHGKVDFASSVDASTATLSSPYTENWIHLMGTEPARGIFLLGRWTRDDARKLEIKDSHTQSGGIVWDRTGEHISPSVMLPMFSRWLSLEKVLADLRVYLKTDKNGLGLLSVRLGEIRRPTGAHYVAFAEVGL